ncbi:MAG: hypothetical protein ACUVSQ_04180 [Pseudanabaenaceae cyanobacterium]
MDPAQKERIALLEQEADAIQLRRNNARDLLDIAKHHRKQPNTFRVQKHLWALALAGCVSIGGIYAQVKEAMPYGGVLGTGVGLAIGLGSNTLDDRRQTREKIALVAQRKRELAALEAELVPKVQQYREEEEIGWLMLALGISKPTLLALREWLADPRRDMKDAILASVDLVQESYLKQSLAEAQTPEIRGEKTFRTLRDRLFSEEIQIQKQEFLQRVARRHTLRQESEKALSQKRSDNRVAIASTVSGTVSGVVAGAAVAGMGSSLARTLGASRNTANWIGAIGGATAVIGVGLLAANAVGEIMRKSEAERQRREAQNFRNALTITREIQMILAGHASSHSRAKIKAAKTVLDKLEAFRERELRTQDPPLQDYVDLLRTGLKKFLRN